VAEKERKEFEGILKNSNSGFPTKERYQDTA
jgi:hypothetical protein